MNRKMYPIVIEVEFVARDEVELTAFLNHLIKFKNEKVIIRRIYPIDESCQGC